MNCNTSREMNIFELLRDVEEAFEEIITVLKRDYTPEEASLHVKAMLGAVEILFEDLGKALQGARPGIESKPGTIVEEVAKELLKMGEELKKSHEPIGDKKGKLEDGKDKPNQTKPADENKESPPEEEKTDEAVEAKEAENKKGKEGDKKKGKPLTLAEQVDILHLAEKTFLAQVKKLNKFLKDDVHPGHIKIQKVIYEMLRKMRTLAHITRPIKP